MWATQSLFGKKSPASFFKERAGTGRSVSNLLQHYRDSLICRYGSSSAWRKMWLDLRPAFFHRTIAREVQEILAASYSGNSAIHQDA